MASDIRISELNEINVNSDVNEIIINSRESSNDTGISKKIQVSNFLTDSIVKTNNLDARSVTTDKIADKSIFAIKIADQTITNEQIANCTITNTNLGSDSVDNRVVNADCGYTVRDFTATSSIVAPAIQASNSLSVPSGTVAIRNIQYKFPATEVPRNFLRTDGAGNLTWAEAVPGDGTALVFSDTSPVGTIIPYAGGQSSVPDDKWINLFSERRFLGSAYPELRDLLGTQWGPRTTAGGATSPTGAYYALPDLRARAVLGAGEGNDGTDSCTTAFATYGGKYRHTLSESEMPSHQHNAFSNASISVPSGFTRISQFGWNASGGSYDDSIQTYKTQPTGGGQSHNNTQPYVAMSYIIKAKPDDIQQYSVNVDAQGTQTAFVNLSSTKIGVKVTDDFTFDGSNRLKINDTWIEENLDLGKPIQYVNRHINTTHRYANVADVDLHITQLDTAATLKDTNSKVYITAMITSEAGSANGVWRLFRVADGIETEIGSNITSGVNNRKGIATGMYDSNNASTPTNIYIQYMDTPGFTAVEYIFKWNGDGTANNYFTLNGSKATNNNEDYEMASSNVNLVEIGG